MAWPIGHEDRQGALEGIGDVHALGVLAVRALERHDVAVMRTSL